MQVLVVPENQLMDLKFDIGAFSGLAGGLIKTGDSIWKGVDPKSHSKHSGYSTGLAGGLVGAAPDFASAFGKKKDEKGGKGKGGSGRGRRTRAKPSLLDLEEVDYFLI